LEIAPDIDVRAPKIKAKADSAAKGGQRAGDEFRSTLIQILP
jgi:hypothetical protein